MGSGTDFSGKNPYGRQHYKTDQVPPVALKASENFASYASSRGGYAPLERHQDNARVVQGPFGPEVWVRPDYPDYRRAFEDVHGEQPSGQGSAGVHIDHAFAKSGAKILDVEWVLVGAVMGGVNTRHGAARERAVRSDIGPDNVPDTVHASQVQMQKILGMAPAGSFMTKISQPVGSQLTRREANRISSYVSGFN